MLTKYNTTLSLDQNGIGDDTYHPFCRHTVAQSPSDHIAGMNIDDRAQIHVAFSHWNVCDI